MNDAYRGQFFALGVVAVQQSLNYGFAKTK